MKRIIASLFAVLMLTSLLASCDKGEGGTTTEPASGSTTEVVTTAAPTEPPATTEAGPRKQFTELQPWEDSGAQSPVSISDKTGTTIGGQFTTDFTITDLSFMCPSWSDNVGSMTFKLYKWNTDYATTIAGEAVATQTFVDYEDNATLVMELEDDIAPAGEYLFVASDGTGGVGMWADNGTYDGYTCYQDGAPLALSLKMIVGGYKMVE
ncbi:MAG: hypothetical protein AB9835_12355 [Eubacteriales bacterium]